MNKGVYGAVTAGLSLLLLSGCFSFASEKQTVEPSHDQPSIKKVAAVKDPAKKADDSKADDPAKGAKNSEADHQAKEATPPEVSADEAPSKDSAGNAPSKVSPGASQPADAPSAPPAKPKVSENAGQQQKASPNQNTGQQQKALPPKQNNGQQRPNNDQPKEAAAPVRQTLPPKSGQTAGAAGGTKPAGPTVEQVSGKYVTQLTQLKGYYTGQLQKLYSQVAAAKQSGQSNRDIYDTFSQKAMALEEDSQAKVNQILFKMKNELTANKLPTDSVNTKRSSYYAELNKAKESYTQKTKAVLGI